ncbi:MAG: radical SAM protein [Elusimicrobia bacterium]|nr:radical SAM protein [Elusimicrobiota bacterium]
MYRKVPFLTFVVSPTKKVKINLAGCNFNCKGCFAIAKKEMGRSFSVEELLNLLIKSSKVILGEMVNDVQMTGGEPTTNADYLISLIQKLSDLHINKIGMSTNGYLLDRNLIKELKSLNINYIKLDLKAYTDKIHKHYTGKSNATILRAVKLLHHYNLNFYVRTIFMPDIMDFEEIKKIAKFLSQISKNITYKIYQFAPEQLDKKVSRTPTHQEMRKAYSVAKRYLDNVEFYTTETAYKPDPYKHIEVRADELLDRFKEIDKISKSVIPDWNMEYFTMNQILNLP